jgi:large repetitive protein
MVYHKKESTSHYYTNFIKIYQISKYTSIINTNLSKMSTITNKHEKTAIVLVTVATLAAILIAAGTIASMGGADMASARTKKPGTDSVRKLATTPPRSGRSNSGILVVNKADQTGTCSTAGGTSGITDSCSNSAASATGVSGGVSGGSSSGTGNSGIAVINKARQSAGCSTAGSSSPIGTSCTNAAASANNITGGVNH